MPKTIDKEMAGWYIRRAYHNYRQAHENFSLNNVESIITSYEAIEFSVKAMCKLLHVKFAPRHFVKAETLSILAEKVERDHYGSKEEILQVIPTILSYTEQLRNLARYGIEKEHVPTATPSKIFRREYAESVLKDAEVLHDLLGKIEIRTRWRPKLRIGILNGFVTGSAETKCTKYPFTNNDPDFWKNKVKKLNSSSGNRFEIKEINASEINEDFAMVLNPFGEEYPEIDLKNKPIFHLIKNYIEDGGVLIHTGGFPFFYAWDVKEGKEYPISEEKIIMPKTIRFEGGTVSAVQMQSYLGFTGTLLFKEFNAIPTPVSEPRKLFQGKDDIARFGDLSSNVGRINEFRALPKTTKGCIPIVRAKDKISEEVYPICALKRGTGYLLLAGMNTEKEKEGDLFIKAIDGFCRWVDSQL